MSEQSEAEVARHRALEDLTPALRHLTANLMRITRGAGHPYRLVEEMVACLRAMQEHRDAVGYGPSTEEIQAALNPDELEEDFTEEEMNRRYDSGTWDRERALVEIRRASLAMTAAMLVNQRLQISRAEMDMRSATDRLEEAHETLRKFHAARRAATPVQRPKKRSPGKRA
ncbi:hypothetical protein [Methylobacterium goesingense]|uniref:Uncharacterized protein n=1 Tax=Methylobacterium goesingense TaxID=243690 RepID=A0ABV2LC02_9HYPH|nr:hypothetical protein [Methylobacterium goesingense]